jgi:hypothetical protein
MRNRRLTVATALLAGALLAVPSSASAAPSTGSDSVFNVRDFGATGDGVTDDAPAFRRAIAAADAVAGSTVYVAAGTYVVDRASLSGTGVLDLTGVSDVAFTGDGASSVIRLRARDWGPVESPALFWCEECDTVSFADLTLDGSRGGPARWARSRCTASTCAALTASPPNGCASRTCTATEFAWSAKPTR